ncbi:RpiB/LacA/LacB family sugar-phosphate isomerase [Legionella dresdenensis]|uniref:RpiB/LacA/LacB family sugar-phosphate isomerase n=1 Tax=Legionella dresdenensis TaxID=450200 RepID=A0ABV8CFZ3_9GAMM
MKVAVVSDELYPVNEFIIQQVKGLGHEVILFGALKSHEAEFWVDAAREAAQAITDGRCDEGIFFCWTGTGITIAANKIDGIRASLCTDSQTAAAARIWNGANVLALSNRLLTQDLAAEILNSWFNTAMNEESRRAIAALQMLEQERE